MLDIECFAFLGRALESELAPLLVMASNRGGDARIRGSTDKSPHGVPRDLLDRSVVVSTDTYSDQELKEIVEMRAVEEDVTLETESLIQLQRIAKESSLRYACNLLTLAQLAAQRRKSTKVTPEHVKRVYRLFLDEKRSAAYLDQMEENLKNSGDQVVDEGAMQVDPISA